MCASFAEEKLEVQEERLGNEQDCREGCRQLLACGGMAVSVGSRVVGRKVYHVLVQNECGCGRLGYEKVVLVR